MFNIISCSQLYPDDFPVVFPSGGPFVLKESIQSVVFPVCQGKSVSLTGVQNWQQAKAAAAAVATSYMPWRSTSAQFCGCLWHIQKRNGEGKSRSLVVLCSSYSHLGHSQSQEALASLPAAPHPRTRVAGRVLPSCAGAVGPQVQPI